MTLWGHNSDNVSILHASWNWPIGYLALILGLVFLHNFLILVVQLNVTLVDRRVDRYLLAVMVIHTPNATITIWQSENIAQEWIRTGSANKYTGPHNLKLGCHRYLNDTGTVPVPTIVHETVTVSSNSRIISLTIWISDATCPHNGKRYRYLTYTIPGEWSVTLRLAGRPLTLKRQRLCSRSPIANWPYS